MTSAILPKSSPDISPPDSVFGWLVVFSSMILLMMAIGPTNAYSVYHEEYHLNVFPDAPTSTLSWIGSLQFGFMCFCCIFSGVLVERYDTRLIVLIGSVLAGSALLIASACNTPTELIFTQGLLFGAGGSCLMVTSMSLPAQYMEKRRALGTSIAAAGGSIGGLCLSFATRAMITHLDWRWSLRITGLIITVVGAAFSTIMRKRVKVSRREKIIDFTILRSIYFILLFIGSAFGTGAYYCFYLFIPAYSVEVLKEPSIWSANIASILNGSSIIGRVAIGLSAQQFGTLNTLYISSLIYLIATFALWLPFKSLGTLIGLAVVVGFFSGNIVSLVPAAAASRFGTQRLSSILGLLFLAYMSGIFVCTPVAAALVDKYGGFKSLIIYTGVACGITTGALFVLRLIAHRN
ncbi:major facilitator superfamily domain-containing protein [Coemansia mojavensis]|nr:major facilitator superfamily domain-containing protein [Coemansia mojavensis]